VPGPRFDCRHKGRRHAVSRDKRDVPACDHAGEAEKVDGDGVGSLEVEEQPAVQRAISECALERRKRFYGEHGDMGREPRVGTMHRPVLRASRGALLFGIRSTIISTTARGNTKFPVRGIEVETVRSGGMTSR